MTIFYDKGNGVFYWVGLANCDICKKDIESQIIVRQEVQPGNNTYVLCSDCAKRSKNRDFGLKQQIIASIIPFEDLPENSYPVMLRLPDLQNAPIQDILKLGGMVKDRTKYAKTESLEGATIGKAIPDRSYFEDKEIPLKELPDFFKDSIPVLSDKQTKQIGVKDGNTRSDMDKQRA